MANSNNSEVSRIDSCATDCLTWGVGNCFLEIALADEAPRSYDVANDCHDNIGACTRHGRNHLLFGRAAK